MRRAAEVVRRGYSRRRRRRAGLPLLAGQRAHVPGLDPHRARAGRRWPGRGRLPARAGDPAPARGAGGDADAARRGGRAAGGRPLGPHRTGHAAGRAASGLALSRSTGGGRRAGRRAARGGGRTAGAPVTQPPGAQRERTRLAWRRTVLAATVVTLLFLRLAGPGAGGLTAARARGGGLRGTRDGAGRTTLKAWVASSPCSPSPTWRCS